MGTSDPPVTQRHGIILAAGKASRLLPLTAQRPKTMVLVGGRPLVQYGIEALQAIGIGSVTVVTGSDGDSIQAFLQDGDAFGMEVQYIQQAEASGPADALRLATATVPEGHDVVVLPGNLYIGPDALKQLHADHGMQLLVSEAQTGHRQGIISVDGGHLRSIAADHPVPQATRVSTGIFQADQEFLTALQDEGGLADEKYLDMALGLHASEHDIKVVEARDAIRGVVDAWDVLRINEDILDGLRSDARLPKLVQRKAPIHIGKDTQVSPSASIIGPVSIGEGCHIGDRAVIGPYVSIRNNTVIGTHSEVRRSIINNNVVVDSQAVIRGSILDDGVQIGAGFIVEEDAMKGCIVGSDATIGSGTLMQPGSVVQPGANVAPKTIVESNE